MTLNKSAHRQSKLYEQRGIIAAAPLDAMLVELRAQADELRAWSPHGDAVNALDLVCTKLENVMRDARHLDVYLTVEDVAHLTHRPSSTISRICRENRAEAGANKIKGVWAIHWPTFEAFIRTAHSQNTQEAA